MAKTKNNYFEMMEKQFSYCVQAADMLEQIICNFSKDTIHEQMEKMHELEHQADSVKHEMTAALAKAFVTPLEREDMALISANIDEVADSIEEVMQRIFVDRIQVIVPEAIDFAAKIVECSQMMTEMLQELVNFKKPKKLHDMIIKLSHKEEERDRLYLGATLKSADFSSDVLAVICWREIFDKLEKCADACEHVGDIIETIVMKNS